MSVARRRSSLLAVRSRDRVTGLVRRCRQKEVSLSNGMSSTPARLDRSRSPRLRDRGGRTPECFLTDTGKGIWRATPEGSLELVTIRDMKLGCRRAPKCCGETGPFASAGRPPTHARIRSNPHDAFGNDEPCAASAARRKNRLATGGLTFSDCAPAEPVPATIRILHCNFGGPSVF